jgi:hypothetical protein
MTLPSGLETKESLKFVETLAGEVAVRVVAIINEGNITINEPDDRVTRVTTIGTSAVQLTRTNDATSLSIHNKSETATLYLGEDNSITADDTSTGGWEIGPGESYNESSNPSTPTWLISDTANTVIKIMELLST